MKTKRKSSRLIVEEDLLLRRGFNQAPMRYPPGNEMTMVIKKVHFKDCCEHQGGTKLSKQLIHLGYYWPIWRLILSPSLERAKHASSIATKSMLQQLN